MGKFVAGADGGFAAFCGIDVGKTKHYAVALTPDGRRLLGKEIDNDEGQLRAVYAELSALGPVLVVVDQVTGIGALPIAVARDAGVEVAYLPGLTMRRLAETHPGRDKTDPRDAFIIADAARTVPHTLRSVNAAEEVRVSLGVLAGFDDDLAAESTRLSNRLRQALLHVHPGLERVLGPKIRNRSVQELLAEISTPAALAALGVDQLAARLRSPGRSRAAGLALAEEILAAVGEQTVSIPGTEVFGTVIASVAARLRAVQAERLAIAKQVEALLDDYPVGKIYTSMPGISSRGAAKLIAIIGDGADFPTAAHLASYAGLAPVVRRSGTSIYSVRAGSKGNRRLKTLLFESSMGLLAHNSESKAYYDKKRAEGKRHAAAMLCLTRRRVDVLHAMLRNGSLYQAPTPATT